MTIDKASNPHDILEVGYGINLESDPANDEYIKKYLPLHNKVSKLYDHLERTASKCGSIKDYKTKRGCALAVEEENKSIKKSLDDVLLTYAKANPKSPIVPLLS